MIAPPIAQDRGQRRSLAVRNWHRRALDGYAKAYDLDLSGEFAGKCHRCLADLYIWEDSRDPARATSYTAATARSLNCPGFFVLYEDDEATGDLLWLRAEMIWPERVTIGNAEDFARYLQRMRDAHRIVYHEPHRLTDA